MKRIFALLSILFVAASVAAQEPKPAAAPKTIASVTGKLQKIDGFAPLYWDNETGKMFLEIGSLNQEILYQVSLPTGVGSNPLGLDRGQLGTTKIVRFERAGNKILMIQPNYAYRALGDNAAERKSVEESFAQSVIWGFRIEAAENDKILVDATAFFLRDAHGVIDRFRQANQGSYNLEESRSAFYLPRTKGFPKNTEVEAILTFTTNGDAGRLLGSVTPTARAVTVRQRHSFIELPDNNYRPRLADPRVGTININFYNYSTGINEDLETRWVTRHRLEKRNPNVVSEPVKPIIYYVDNGAPPEIRDALIEGAAWWNQAYEAAGFKNAFQVKVLPPDADPMDVRYNVINWVHRSTRGWSIGNSITDPRTGEIIRGVVTLDSQRARQDFLLGAGLVPQYDKNAACDFAALPDVDYLTTQQTRTDAEKMSFARIRQLSAHEVGHTLGFPHNFAASTYAGRGSVMDYPAPLVEIKNGKLDFSNAYGVGIGEYDKFAVRYAYTQFAPNQNEAAELEKIVRDGVAKGMLFISDDDTRPAGAAHPLANLWDNGADPIANLRHELNVRRIGLEQFGMNSIADKMPLSMLESKFLPLYLHHRYQTTAAVKSIGGVYYTYAVKTDKGANPAQVYEIVSPERQREALRVVLETLKPDELVISDRILRMIPPTAYGFDYGRAENFPSRTNPTFDAGGAATIAADMTISALLEPNRAARLIEFNARDARNPHFADVLGALMAATWNATPATDRQQFYIQRAVQSLLVTRLMDLAANDRAAPAVRAHASAALRALKRTLENRGTLEIEPHERATVDDIERFLTRPDAPRKQTMPLPAPPGDPIGAQATRLRVLK